MSYTTKPFEELDVMDDFLMNVTADDEEVGEEFTRTLLKGLLQRELGKIQISVQKVMVPNTPNHRGVRLDVEVNEYEEVQGRMVVKNIYDVEPNKRQEVHLPKHNRFYQAKIDSRNLVSGEKSFDNLPDLFIIMITDYDPFGYDHMVYTVCNQCVELPELEYKDGLMFIYFNTTGSKGGSPAIKKLLNFIEDSTINNVTDEVTKKLHDCISKVKISPEVRMEYMKWDAMIYYERKDAKVEVIFELLEEIGNVSDELREKLSKETELEKIKKWIKLAAKVTSIEEFIEKM